MRILILDDDACRHKEFNRRLMNHTVKNVFEAWEAIEALKTELWDWVFLDHDLYQRIHVTSGDGTGYEVAKWLRDNPDRQPENIIIHSYNTEGANNMKSLLPKAIIHPGVWTKINI
jgi:CheY-like chemotaxis protein